MKQAGRGSSKIHNLMSLYEAEEKAGKLLATRFGQMNLGEIPPIDAAIMRRLNEMLRLIDETLLDACFLRGLLPSATVEALMMAGFLSFTLPSARAAQSVTGVPASALIAEAYEISGPYFYGDHFDLGQAHDLFATGKKFSSFHAAFLHRAEELKRSKQFAPVLKANGTSQYLEQLEKWSQRKYGIELVAKVKQHRLVECDRLKDSCFI